MNYIYKIEGKESNGDVPFNGDVTSGIQPPRGGDKRLAIVDEQTNAL